MFSKVLVLLAIICTFSVSCMAADQNNQSQLNPARSKETAKKYPQIVLYSVSWCPHCREAKEYLTRNNIPFINRDVEVDTNAMEELTGKYNSNGVPVIVIGTGSNEIVVKGFSSEQFMESLNKAQIKK